MLKTFSRPDSGSGGSPASTCSPSERVSRAIGVVAQKPGVDLDATGRENLTLQGRIYGVTGRQLKLRVDALSSARPHARGDPGREDYSGGCSAGSNRDRTDPQPAVLFLDEPTTGLDPEARADMWDEIASLAREEPITILLTTHYLEEADELAAQLAIVDRGRIVAAGTPDGESSLEGDSLQIELAELPVDGDVRRARARRGSRRARARRASPARTRARRGDRDAVAHRRAQRGRAHAVAKLSLSRPSLDDVYLRVAGRASARPTPSSRRDPVA